MKEGERLTAENKQKDIDIAALKKRVAELETQTAADALVIAELRKLLADLRKQVRAFTAPPLGSLPLSPPLPLGLSLSRRTPLWTICATSSRRSRDRWRRSCRCAPT